jgi:chromosome segregation ATPase
MTETQRTTLYNQLSGAIGQEAARTLMEQLPPSGWEQVATKEDVKASENMLLREIKASETRVLGEVKQSEGRLMIHIADSESRQGARIDETNTRIDGMNTRIDETNTRIDGMNTRIDQTNTRLDETNTRIDGMNTRIDQTNREMSELKGEVRTGFAELKLALARHTLWMAAAVVGVAASLAVPLTIALL